MAHSAVLHDQLLALTISDTLVDENTSSGFPGKSTVFIASLIQTMPIENQVCHWQLALVRQHLFERRQKVSMIRV